MAWAARGGAGGIPQATRRLGAQRNRQPAAGQGAVAATPAEGLAARELTSRRHPRPGGGPVDATGLQQLRPVALMSERDPLVEHGKAGERQQLVGYPKPDSAALWGERGFPEDAIGISHGRTN